MKRGFTPLDGWRYLTGFTLIELLIVISIIAILAAAVIPNFVGFDTEARVAATKSNLDTLRSRITLFRAKEGRYPESLEDLVGRSYTDAGVKKRYLKKIPAELVSSKKGSSAAGVKSSSDSLGTEGGWVYLSDTAEVVIHYNEKLDHSWGEYAGQRPSEW